MDITEAIRATAESARPAAACGKVADYIPQLRDLDPDLFALALTELDGREHVIGDVDTPFPIQSMSKVFALVLAMQEIGGERAVRREIRERVGREPSGDPFNSLVQLEYECGIPRNPMINAGALVIDDLLLEHYVDPVASMLGLVRKLAGQNVELDSAIAEAGDKSSQRNRAMARRVMALMLTGGTYDAAGEFAFSVGLPCKSGVAGGIMVAAPDHSGICVWSPPLDDSGNSLARRVALHDLTDRLDLSTF